MYQLPMWFQKASTAFVLLAEVIVPFLFFAPRRFRLAGAWIAIVLQLLILLTGNYTFFNLLTIVLALFLFVESKSAPRAVWHRAVSIGLASFIGVTSGLLVLDLFSLNLPPGGAALLHKVAPLRIVNTYGLFTVMTVNRPEIQVEGSNDGEHWLPYQFPFKPGDVDRMPPVVAPYQPRLDWQMWFAALGRPRENPWFIRTLICLLDGKRDVVRLLATNPFPGKPPRYIRALFYRYRFTTAEERRKTGAWWKHQELHEYVPAFSLDQVRQNQQ
jgi:hypothetical protein